ncbi:MAG TPA: DUF4350 domain-containing protein, partial [Roseiflexaceae bacterium]|nr:DUF4350 domain-containing protein [Roseiflexaceae bacterium]
LLEHNARPGRRYAEIQQMGAELRQLGDRIANATIEPAVAMVLSYDSRFAFQIQPNNPQLSYPGHFFQIYRALQRRNVPVDIVAPDADLAPYRLVIAPALHVLPARHAAHLERFVEAGGTLVVTARTGVKDEANAVVNLALPGLLADLCGIVIDDYDSLAPGETRALAWAIEDSPALQDGQSSAASVWCDVIRPTTAGTLARYQQGYYAGEPAVTTNHYGSGQAVYVGTMGDEQLWSVLAAWLLDSAHVKALLATPAGVEVTLRRQGEAQLLFVLNHTGQQQTVELGGDAEYTDLLQRSSIEHGMLSIAALDVAILQTRNERGLT